ncbi:hypothetical protein HDU85_000583 [Gaertneriomyces sp. JEL0708]|nr:hypothetical protein HDU85_000583 [Gaertneriomyces sp. JEL0708]
MADLDPSAVVGLPDAADRMATAKTAAIAKPAVRLQPKGSKKEVDRYNREKKIAENMSKMPERIAAWKEERRKAKEAAKPEMPF